jgi:YfiR/HmsC-like
MIPLTQRRKAAKKLFFLLILLLALHPYHPLWGKAEEYELKADFLYNFTQFVQWPETAFSAPDSPFQLCLIGEDPFGRTLDETVISEFVGKHPIVVRRIRDVDNTPACHLAFVSAKSDIPFETVLETTRDSPVLLVGEDPESAEKGGTIGFRVVNRRIRLTINLAAARAADLRISSKLLRLSTIVEN